MHNRKRLICNVSFILEDRTVPDDNSAGSAGIDARLLGFPSSLLDGTGISIGQIESERAGLRFLDANQTVRFDSDANSHIDVKPKAVYIGMAPAVANQQVNDHAIAVAGVMIANGNNSSRGVSPSASLYSTSTNVDNLTLQERFQVIEKLADANNDDIPAINMSYLASNTLNEVISGDTGYARFLDYVTRRADTLFAIASATDDPALPMDTSYNNLIVAGSS